ncbi:MAG: hypothetical protein ACI936_003686 [Paraglaciecola sp.]|jgi:hypothetical protein
MQTRSAVCAYFKSINLTRDKSTHPEVLGCVLWRILVATTVNMQLKAWVCFGLITVPSILGIYRLILCDVSGVSQIFLLITAAVSLCTIKSVA